MEMETLASEIRRSENGIRARSHRPRELIRADGEIRDAEEELRVRQLSIFSF